MHYFVSFLVLESSWRGSESWLLCFYCLSDVLLPQMFCGSSSPDHTELLLVARYKPKYANKVLVNRLVNLPRKKEWLGELTALTFP